MYNINSAYEIAIGFLVDDFTLNTYTWLILISSNTINFSKCLIHHMEYLLLCSLSILTKKKDIFSQNQFCETTVSHTGSVNVKVVVLLNFANINNTRLCIYLMITGGVDYNIDPSCVIFINGMTTASLHVSINDDSKFETHETFIVSIDPLSLPYGVILDSTASAVVTIVDDDSKLIYVYYAYVILIINSYSIICAYSYCIGVITTYNYAAIASFHFLKFD